MYMPEQKDPACRQARPARLQAGHAFIVLMVIACFLLIAIWFVSRQYGKPITLENTFQPPQQELTYKDSDLKFEFKYSDKLDTTAETEEEYSKRTGTEYRKNFAGYVAYQPPKFVKSLIIKPKTMKLSANQYDPIPLTIWVFENPNKLTIDDWYKNFWYYPFLWGVFSFADKAKVAPADVATVSGITTKSAVDNSQGKPEYILLPKNDKMYLFKVMDGGSDILRSFKFN